MSRWQLSNKATLSLWQHVGVDVAFCPISAAPVGRLCVRYLGSCCRAGSKVGEAVDDPKRTFA